MVLSIISRLKWKGSGSTSASEHSPLPPCDLNCSTKLDGLSRSFDDSNDGIILMIGGGMFFTGLIVCSYVELFVDESKVDEFFLTHWSNVNRFLRGIWTREADWGNLPPELWGEIGKRMVSPLDIICFRSVCKRWRSSLPSPTGRFPLLLPPPPSCDPEFRDIPYTISELAIYRKGVRFPSMQVDQGIIITLHDSLSFEGDKADFDEESLLESPVRLRTFDSVWKEKARARKPYIRETRLYSDFSLFAKAYYPCKALDSHELRRRECNKFPKKLVLISSSNADGVNPNYARMSDLSVVAHLGGEMKGRLALLRLGGSPENWVWDTDFCTQVFVNIGTYKGQLCALNQWGRVFLMDYNSLKLTLLCVPLYIPPELEEMSLVEACGDLYLVDFKLKSNDINDVADAYKLSLQPQMWLKVDNMFRSSFQSAAPFLL